MKRNIKTIRKICMVGNFDINHPKEAVIRRSLKDVNVEIIDYNLKKKISGIGFKKILYLPFVIIDVYRGLYPIIKNVDLIFVPHGNHFIVPIVRIIADIFHKPVVFDAFDPQYQHSILHNDSWIRSHLIWLLEKIAFSMSHRILVVSEAMKTLYMKTYRVGHEKISTLPCGADEKKWYPQKRNQSKQNDKFSIVYWGRFHEQHGIDIIVSAATKLDSSRFEFIMAGDGKGRKSVQQYCDDHHINNIKFTGFLDHIDLLKLISESDIVLGMFSDTPPAMNSVSWKVSEALAMGVPVLTERSPAICEHLNHRQSAYLVDDSSGDKLFQAILDLAENEELRKLIAIQGKQCFENNFSSNVLGKRLKKILLNTLYTI